MEVRMKCRECGVIVGVDEGNTERRMQGKSGFSTFWCECKKVTCIQARDLCWIFSTKDVLALVDQDNVEIDFFVVSDEEGTLWRILHLDDRGRVCASLFTLELALQILKDIQIKALKSAESFGSVRSKINEVCCFMEERIKDGMKDGVQDLENFDFITIIGGLGGLNCYNYNLRN